jgi:hypothetical protein
MTDPEPIELLADLDARALRAWIEPSDPDDPKCDDVALVISDGDTTIRIVSGMGDSAMLAQMGAQRLGDVARQFAEALTPKPISGPIYGPVNGP